VLSLAADESERVRARIGFDERLARRIYASADLLLVPSRYEPCGMTQMIAMRYGAIPVARETGGLADTVRDLDLADAPTGVLFPEASAPSLAFAIRRALAWRRRPERWASLIANAMAEDSSWERSAAAYAELYDEMGREAASRAAAEDTASGEASDGGAGSETSDTANDTASGGGA
jgi:starch synthase